MYDKNVIKLKISISKWRRGDKIAYQFHNLAVVIYLHTERMRLRVITSEISQFQLMVIGGNNQLPGVFRLISSDRASFE